VSGAKDVRTLRRIGRGGGARLHITYLDAAGVEHLATIAEAAPVAFEECLPVRRIPSYRNSKHTPGRYWSATNGGLVEYESYLESKWMTLLDFDPQVVAFAGQPLRFDGVDTDGVWAHTPDIFARLADGTGRLVDVKNPEHLNRPDVLTQARRSAEVSAALGWDYQMVGDVDPQRWANVSWMAGFRRPLHAGADLIPRLLALAQRPVSIGELLSFMPHPSWPAR
jgi:hypothetical protein